MIIYKGGGGLSRSEDYGSDKNPYPSVSKRDFAGGGRSYPIPTRADAVDALRLAGMHGRSDVKSKVYAKYPDLKKASGGVMEMAVGGEMQGKGAPNLAPQPVQAPQKFARRNVMPVQIAKTAPGHMAAVMRGQGMNPDMPYHQGTASSIQDYLNTTKGGPKVNYTVVPGAEGQYEGYQRTQISDTPLYSETEITPGSGRFQAYDLEGQPISQEEAAKTSQQFYQAKYPTAAHRQEQARYRGALGMAGGGKVGCKSCGGTILYKRKINI